MPDAALNRAHDDPQIEGQIEVAVRELDTLIVLLHGDDEYRPALLHLRRALLHRLRRGPLGLASSR